MTRLTRAESKAATREKILSVARDLFRAHPYEAVTIRRIAEAADMSTGAVYAGWPDKTALWREALRLREGARPVTPQASALMLETLQHLYATQLFQPDDDRRIRAAILAARGDPPASPAGGRADEARDQEAA